MIRDDLEKKKILFFKACTIWIFKKTFYMSKWIFTKEGEETIFKKKVYNLFSMLLATTHKA